MTVDNLADILDGNYDLDQVIGMNFCPTEEGIERQLTLDDLDLGRNYYIPADGQRWWSWNKRS
eukprot:CAMPEP_0116003698 /NCGR_PEP_ID=MMETSP0321-20121206/193_1 /TAXON_ID=163516 /ORGANISM="Leptocylindrus danicus var. danicus, Strain B650" /LENGTH=62 /DNA_ID=CAMNT_0003471921 /DNA_START=1073 /DNA_END=1261 /DNA_ORIENTATION=+